MPNHPGFAFDQQSVDRIASAVQIVESGGLADDVAKPNTGNRPAGTILAKVTATSSPAGDHTGDMYFNTDGSWVQGIPVIIRELNGLTLKTNKYYSCRLIGVKADGGAHKPLLAVATNQAADVSQSVLTDVTCTGSSLSKTFKTLTIPGGTVT